MFVHGNGRFCVHVVCALLFQGSRSIMGKGIKRAAKGAKGEQAFAKKKHKVGRKLKAAQNDTTVDVKIKQLNLPSQAALDAKETVPTSDNNLTRAVRPAASTAVGSRPKRICVVGPILHKIPVPLQELLSQAKHYSEKVRRSSLPSLSSLFTKHPAELTAHLAEVLPALAGRITDADSATRAAFRALWSDTIAPLVTEQQLAPFTPLILAHVSSAATHLQVDMRLDALRLVEMLAVHSPRLIAAGHLAAVLHLFCSTLSQARLMPSALPTSPGVYVTPCSNLHAGQKWSETEIALAWCVGAAGADSQGEFTGDARLCCCSPARRVARHGTSPTRTGWHCAEKLETGRKQMAAERGCLGRATFCPHVADRRGVSEHLRNSHQGSGGLPSSRIAVQLYRPQDGSHGVPGHTSIVCEHHLAIARRLVLTATRHLCRHRDLGHPPHRAVPLQWQPSCLRACMPHGTSARPAIC